MSAVPPVAVSGSFLRRLRQGIRRIEAADDWEAWAGTDWPARIMHEELTDRLHQKQGRSIVRWTLHDGARSLVAFLKRHYRLEWWRGLAALLLPQRAWTPGLQEWHNLHQASELGLPVPRPLAAGEFIGPWGALQSFLAVEELTDQLPLHLAVPLASRTLTATDFQSWKIGLTTELVRLIKLLHDRSWFHKDLYFCHFYIAEQDCGRVPTDWTGRVTMIDFHRLARHRLTHAWWLLKDLAQFAYSSEVEGVTARDRMRFWRLLRGRTPSRWSNFLARWIRLRWGNYRRHNRRKEG